MAYKNNNYDNSNNDRKWSDDLGYLETLAWLINKSHEASMDADQDVYDWFFILEQWQLEIMGQLKFRNMDAEIKELNKLRIKTSNNIDSAYEKIGKQVGSLPPKDVSKLRRLVYPYHEELTILTHAMDLRLHDVKPKTNEELPTWSKN